MHVVRACVYVRVCPLAIPVWTQCLPGSATRKVCDPMSARATAPLCAFWVFGWGDGTLCACTWHSAKVFYKVHDQQYFALHFLKHDSIVVLNTLYVSYSTLSTFPAILFSSLQTNGTLAYLDQARNHNYALPSIPLHIEPCTHPIPLRQYCHLRTRRE